MKANEVTPIEEDRHEELMAIMKKHEIDCPEVADLTGYSLSSIHGLTMPNRESSRARKVSERFLKLLKYGLQEKYKKFPRLRKV